MIQLHTSTAPVKLASLAAVFLLVLMLSAAGCGTQTQPEAQKLEGRTMGTSWHATLVHAPNNVDFQQLIQDAVEQVDRRMSTYREDSELSRFNRAGAGEFAGLTAMTMKVLVGALHIAKCSDGAFDPTILPLVEGWGFGAKQGSEQPSAAQIEQWKTEMGWQQVLLKENGTVHKSKATLRIDLSANAKGFGVDHAAAAIENAGCTNFLIEVGGELRSAGTKADGSAWRIGIDRPVPSVLAAHQLQQVIQISDWSVATSGDYRNYREVDGKRVSHLIDPRSGYPISHNLVSVTVVAGDCMTADGLATAISILGVDEGLKLLLQFPGSHAYFVLRDCDTFTVRESEGFAPFKVE